MSSQRLSSELEWSSDNDTTIDVPTALQTWDVPDGASVTLREGLVAIADLETTTGNSGPAGGDADPSRSTRIAFAFREPDAPLDHWTVFSHELPVAPFNDLTLSEQQSGENAQNRRFTWDPEHVPGSSITFEDADEIAILAEGPDEIDGSESQFSFPMDFNQG